MVAIAGDGASPEFDENCDYALVFDGKCMGTMRSNRRTRQGCFLDREDYNNNIWLGKRFSDD